MSGLTAEDHRGWRGPFLEAVEVARGRALSGDRRRDWYDAVEIADRMVSISGWASPLAPGHKDVDLGLRAVVRRGRPARPQRVLARFYERGSIESSNGWARLDLPVTIPAAWTRLASPAFRLRAVSAILETLAALGATQGIGPPPLRPRPTVPKTLDVNDEQRLELGRWLSDQIDATEAGWATVAARQTGERRRQRRRRFLGQLRPARELPTPDPETLVAWRVQLLPVPSGDEARETR